MSLSAEKKNELRLYLLEKIAQGEPSPVQKTAANFGVTPATVYRYLDQLEADGTVQNQKRGCYVLIEKTTAFRFDRNDPLFASEELLYRRCILPHLSSLPENVQEIWAYLCSEMLNNVIDHSQAENLAITVTQDALRTSVQIADDGVGIFEKIRRFLSLYSNEEAVGELFKGKLTTDAAHHSGEGIFFSSRLADSFIIISSGLVFSHDRFDSDALL